MGKMRSFSQLNIVIVYNADIHRNVTIINIAKSHEPLKSTSGHPRDRKHGIKEHPLKLNLVQIHVLGILPEMSHRLFNCL